MKRENAKKSLTKEYFWSYLLIGMVVLGVMMFFIGIFVQFNSDEKREIKISQQNDQGTDTAQKNIIFLRFSVAFYFFVEAVGGS